MTNGIKIFDLTGKRVLITGSSQGIGLTLARGLGEAGATVVVNGRDKEKLTAAAQELNNNGIAAEELPFDVTDHAQVVKSIASATSKLGDIDVLINNAGMQHRTPLEDFDPDVFNQMLQTNIASVFNVGQVVAKHMIARGSGKIINIASVVGIVGNAGQLNYVSAKAGLIGFSKALAQEVAKKGDALKLIIFNAN